MALLLHICTDDTHLSKYNLVIKSSSEWGIFLFLLIYHNGSFTPLELKVHQLFHTQTHICRVSYNEALATFFSFSF